MTDPWATVLDYSFTTYFGTALHGASITWYNNPAGTGNTATDASELKLEFT